MSEKRDQIVGIRLTKTEKKEIDNYTKNKGSNLTEFIRRAIAFYLNNLEENPELTNMYKVIEHSKKIETSLKNVKSNFDQLKFALDKLSNDTKQLDNELVIHIRKWYKK